MPESDPKSSAHVTTSPELTAGLADLPSRLRLKRIFLLALVISLTAGALVAVVALISFGFGDRTMRILGTLFALAFHSAVAMVCALSLERRWWPALSVAGLILFAASFALDAGCIWLPGLSEEQSLRAAGSTAALSGYFVLAIPCASLRERRRAAPVALAGLATCVVGLLMLLACIWATEHESELFGKATAIVALVAFSFAHTSLLLHVRPVPSLSILRTGCIVCVWALALWATRMILEWTDDQVSIRGLGALGVLDACGSLALFILAKVKQVQKIENLTTAPAQLEICCPRCTARQVVAAGASKCGACGLKFRIEIEEPRCAKCDYLLWQLPERRCPECGTPF